MLLCSITRLPAWKRKGTYLRENNPALPQKHLHLPHPPDLAAALSLALWTCVMQATRRLLRIPRASIGPVGACCSTPGANSNTQWLHKDCVRVCSPKALGRWARSRWHGTNAGEKTFRPSLGCICCIRPSCVWGRISVRWWSSASLAIHTLDFVAQRSRIHMPICLPRALRQKGRWQRLFPHNCSTAVERRRRYRGCGRWRAPCRRRDRLRLTG